MPLVMSHYLTDMGNLFTNLKNDYRYRVQLYPSIDSSEPRKQQYKTKYLKSYRTQLLMDLPLSVFQYSDGYWRDGVSVGFALVQCT